MRERRHKIIWLQFAKGTWAFSHPVASVPAALHESPAQRCGCQSAVQPGCERLPQQRGKHHAAAMASSGWIRLDRPQEMSVGAADRPKQTPRQRHGRNLNDGQHGTCTADLTILERLPQHWQRPNVHLPCCRASATRRWCPPLAHHAFLLNTQAGHTSTMSWYSRTTSSSGVGSRSL